MTNKRCTVDQRINGQWTYQWTTEVVPSTADNPVGTVYKYTIDRLFPVPPPPLC